MFARLARLMQNAFDAPLNAITEATRFSHRIEGTK